MASAGTGPKMIIDQVVAAERIVDDAVKQMLGVAKKLHLQSAASLTAMQAPAGQATAANFDAHSGAGRALAETLAELQRDLGTTRAVLESGSDHATQVAKQVQADVAAQGAGAGGRHGHLSSQLAT